MINMASTTAKKVKDGQILYHKNVHCKEGLIVRQGEVDISGIVTTIESPGQLAINHNAKHAVRPNGHWSHLSDLPSKGTPLECTTICDTCYLKQLLIRIWMILMYHNENVTAPI